MKTTVKVIIGFAFGYLAGSWTSEYPISYLFIGFFFIVGIVVIISLILGIIMESKPARSYPQPKQMEDE